MCKKVYYANMKYFNINFVQYRSESKSHLLKY